MTVASKTLTIEAGCIIRTTKHLSSPLSPSRPFIRTVSRGSRDMTQDSRSMADVVNNGMAENEMDGCNPRDTLPNGGFEEGIEVWMTADQISEMWPSARMKAVEEFVHIYHLYKDIESEEFLWGDEIEYYLVHFDDKKKIARVSIEAKELKEKLEKSQSNNGCQHNWQEEFLTYMIESIPGVPFAGDVKSINDVERSMSQRRRMLQRALDSPNKAVISVGNFPRTGCRYYTWPAHAPSLTSVLLHSQFVPSEVIGEGRYEAISLNCRLNCRGRRTEHIPIYKDVMTSDPFLEDFSQFGNNKPDGPGDIQPNTIFVDNGIIFFGGCCSLQITLQGRTLSEARTIHDQLTPLSPILMALSASAPILRGLLSDVDSRWAVCLRIPEITNEKQWQRKAKSGPKIKLRIDSVGCYTQPWNSALNDGPLYTDTEVLQSLLEHGVDETLSRYVTNLFSREPVGISNNQQCGKMTNEEASLYTVVQASNYPSVRLKIPTKTCGWRVEFRPLDVQLTDFENAAFAVFLVLLTKAIVKYNINLAIPITKVDENMENATKRDAVRTCKFYFKESIFVKKDGQENNFDGIRQNIDNESNNNAISLMTADEIVNGKIGVFIGLIPLIRRYLDDHKEMDAKTRLTADSYLNFIAGRASGEIPTTARWIREFVTSHPDYKKDSVVSDVINYDLMRQCAQRSDVKTCASSTV